MSSRCLAPAATFPMIALLASTVLLAPGVAMAQMAATPTESTTATGQTPTVAPAVPTAQPVAPAATQAPAVPPAAMSETAGTQSLQPAAPTASPSATATDTPASISQPALADTAPTVATETAPPAASDEGSTSLLPDVFEVPREDLPHDLSPIGMFLAADWVVKFVMISLAFASLVTWTVWFGKTLQLAGARNRAARALRLIGDARTLEAAIQSMQRRRGVVAAMLNAAQEEMRFSDAAIDHAGGGGVKERVGSALSRIEVRAGRNMSKGTGVLATIGSTAPFVGLFGTVWGIMNSFIGISESNTTNLAVVAPGIAEALLATAIGLVAAIPAVIIYNVFARSITSYRQLLGDASAQVERLVSRDLDFRKVPASAATASKIKLVTE